MDAGGGAPGPARFEPDPVIEAYKKDIDRTLLRENLGRTVEERLRDLMRLQRFAEEWGRAGRRWATSMCWARSRQAAAMRP